MFSHERNSSDFLSLTCSRQIITMGKKGDLPAYQRANAFLLEPRLTPKVFKTLAARYADRPGGYTRIHKFGNRQGDNAPHAVLELVDNPRDIKFDMTARAVGWEVLGKKVGATSPTRLAETGVDGIDELITRERTRAATERGDLRVKTRWSLQKVLRFRGKAGEAELQRKTEDHIVRGLACRFRPRLTFHRIPCSRSHWSSRR